jgi:hypothetical protein
MTMRRMTILAAAAAALLLGACGEREQQASAVRKSDAPAAQGAANPYVAPGWTAGDAASWEAQMRKRAQGQNEYSRIAGS